MKPFILLCSVFLLFSCSYLILSLDTSPTNNNTVALATAEPQSITICPATQEVSWSAKLSNLIQTSTSLWFRLLLVFMLGLLMSLTPCIYPMIPVTIGILQAQGSKSLLRNFLLAFTYTLGISTTFALLGLLAAFSGQVFGSLLVKPIVIVPLIILLAYLAGSMLGLYEMYVPRWMQPSSREVKRGSFISTFLFGVASGTVASPCLSPGLVFLLSIVTALANKALGFLLLFIFGIGLSVPLLFIGSFSGSITVLPKAGVWMVEIKRLIGLMLIGVCFYFLNNIVPLPWTLGLAGCTTLMLGFFYLYIVQKQDSLLWRITKSTIGIVLIAGSVILFSRTYRTLYQQPIPKALNQCWMLDYKQAQDKALKQNKLLFIDVGAPCCSICHAIDAKFFTDAQVLATLTNKAVLLKIDGSDTTNASTCTVLNTYKVIGFPTLLLVDPRTESVVQKWGGELYSRTTQEFITDVDTLFQVR